MRLLVALPIAAALAIGISSLAPAQAEAKTKIFARCKAERAACVTNCIAYPCPQRCRPRLTRCAKGGGGERPPKEPMFGKSTGAAGGGLPPVARQSKR
jgi:hypothetical protein